MILSNRKKGRFGPEGLYDHRHINHRKIDEKAERQIVQTTLQWRHRSARLIAGIGLKPTL